MLSGTGSLSLKASIDDEVPRWENVSGPFIVEVSPVSIP